jgi:hypothetical protein
MPLISVFSSTEAEFLEAFEIRDLTNPLAPQEFRATEDRVREKSDSSRRKSGIVQVTDPDTDVEPLIYKVNYSASQI